MPDQFTIERSKVDLKPSGHRYTTSFGAMFSRVRASMQSNRRLLIAAAGTLTAFKFVERAEYKRKKHGLQLMFPLVFHTYPQKCQDLDLRMKGIIAPHLKLLRKYWSAGKLEEECRDLSIRSTACVASIKRGEEKFSTPQNLRRYIRVQTLRNRLYGQIRRNVLATLERGTATPFRDMELEVLVDAMEREADPDWTVLFESYEVS